METDQTFTSFAGDKLIYSGDMNTTVLKTKERLDSGEKGIVLVFDDRTGKQVDFDWRGTPKDVLGRLATHPMFKSKDKAGVSRPGPGRPKLGVVCREVSLLPRHWDWLEQQPQGISGSLRRLVEDAKRRDPDKERARLARDAAGKFMWAMAGNLPGFEEASRALFALDKERLDKQIHGWPKDIRSHILQQVHKALALTPADKNTK